MVAEYQQEQAELMRREKIEKSGEETVSKPLNGCDNGLDLASVPGGAPAGDAFDPPLVVSQIKDRPVLFHRVADRMAVIQALDLQDRQVGRFVCGDGVGDGFASMSGVGAVLARLVRCQGTVFSTY